MIAVIDYNMGNIRSLGNAIGRLGAEWVLTSDPAAIRKASHVILPGVGNAGKAMHNIHLLGLESTLLSLRRPVLGICVGMQVMCLHSDEGDVDCLGIFDTKVCHFEMQDNLKVPHMGWSRISNLESKLFKGVDSGAYVYFVHSYYASLCNDTIATARHGIMFSAALKYENYYGTQFHPEKSGDVGETVLKNFLEI